MTIKSFSFLRNMFQLFLSCLSFLFSTQGHVFLSKQLLKNFEEDKIHIKSMNFIIKNLEKKMEKIPQEDENYKKYKKIIFLMNEDLEKKNKIKNCIEAIKILDNYFSKIFGMMFNDNFLEEKYSLLEQAKEDIRSNIKHIFLMHIVSLTSPRKKNPFQDNKTIVFDADSLRRSMLLSKIYENYCLLKKNLEEIQEDFLFHRIPQGENTLLLMRCVEEAFRSLKVEHPIKGDIFLNFESKKSFYNSAFLFSQYIENINIIKDPETNIIKFSFYVHHI